MRIVVIGASGNIGTAVLRQLRGTAHEVVAVARRRPDPHREEGARWVRCDAAADDLGPVLDGADAVVNLAWLIQPSHRPQVTWENNVGVAERILRAAREQAVPTVVFASSVAAYAPAEGAGESDESHPTHGASPAAYAREKAYVERMLDAFEASTPDCRVVRLRPAFVFQQPAATEQRRLFAGPLVPGRLMRPELLPALPVPRGIRLQTVHADDVADAVVRAVDRDVTGAFNLAADGVLDESGLAAVVDARPVAVPARLFRGAMAAAWHSRAVPAPPDLFDALLALPTMSTRRARTELDWQPTVSAASALQEFLHGLVVGADHPTPPLDASTSGPLRSREFGTGVGGKP
jgi:UDP-glucose 4-epimerase